MGNCAGCKHWERKPKEMTPYSKTLSTIGVCNIIKRDEEGKISPEALFWIEPVHSLATLVTLESFVCRTFTPPDDYGKRHG